MAEMQVEHAAADEVDDPGDQDDQQDRHEQPEEGPQPAGQVRAHACQLPANGRGMRGERLRTFRRRMATVTGAH